MLVIVAHPGIGSGIETLLRLERRFDVRWVRSAAEAGWPEWAPDLVVAEKATLGNVALPHPTIMLVGELPSAEVARAAGASTRWMRKETPAQDLVAAIDGMLGSAGAGGRRSSSRLVITAIALLAVVALAAYFLRLALT